MATRERCGNHLGAARAVLITLIGVLAWLAPANSTAADKSLSFDSLNTLAELRADGSMLITEQWTYVFDGGPFNFGIRSFERNRNQIGQLTASDAEGPLEVIRPADSISGDWEWRLRRPTSDATVTYTLTYFVEPVVIAGRDVSELEWQFLGTDHPGVGKVDIRIRFPLVVNPATPESSDDDATVLRAFAHGPSNGVVRVATSEVIASVSDVPAGQFVEIRAVAPAATFNIVGDENRLATILAEERSYLSSAERQADNQRGGWLLSAMVAALGAVGTGALWLVGGREAKSKEVLGEYWREPLDEPPAVTLAIVNRGGVEQGPTVACTLVDMAQRGYLRIVGEREERLGPDRVVHRYVWLGKPFAPDVLAYEKDLLEMVFRGTTEMTSEELTAWATEHQTTAKKLLDEVTGGVKSEYDARGYATESNRRLVGTLLAICAGVVAAGWIVKLTTGYGLGWWGVMVGAVLLGVGSRLLSNRNQASVEAAAKAEGLRKYLKDFSQLEDAPVGHLILWERYLVYAVALGVSAELVRGLALRLPEVVANPAFGVWYSGPRGRFDGFDDMASTSGSSFVSAATPNTSGGGGGFSGGGGGGGGGGGAGAR